jgi:hypothetical protein
MALLNRLARREHMVAALAASAALALGGCMILEMVGLRSAEEPGPAFSHRVHVQMEGMDCGDCHMGVYEEDAPGMPVPMLCSLCHEATDEGTTYDLTYAALFGADGQLAPSRSLLADEIIFSHLQHVTANDDCAACHGGIAAADRTPRTVGVTMDQCMACHAQQGISNDCATCHTVIREDYMPPSHDLAWMEVHGSVARAHPVGTSDNCALCHQESTCTACHQLVPPQDHTNFWRIRGHGFVAGLDRSRCQTCHQPDYCNQCHAHTQPMSHTGSWGGTLSTHCLSCHIPVQQTGCFTCHKDTRSHALAAPKPPDHFAAMNCRQCHGQGAPLPHVDNGADCNICHH